MRRFAAALALAAAFAACTDEAAAPPTTTSTTAVAPTTPVDPACLRSVKLDVKVLGPPTPPDVIVTPDAIVLNLYNYETGDLSKHQASLAPGEFAALLPTACAQSDIPNPRTDTLGYNAWLTTDGDGRVVDLSGQTNLHVLPFMGPVNQLAQKYFGRPAFDWGLNRG
jgi:hypothetical protein